MKNAYEIRLEVLQMAHRDAMRGFEEKLNFLRSDDKGNYVPVNADKVDSLFPKTKDIISRAEELYKFVEEK